MLKLKYLLKNISIDPNHAKAQSFKSSRQDHPSEDISELPSNIDTLKTMAVSHLDKQEFSEAKRVLYHLLQLNSNYLPARRYLADIYLQEAVYGAAIHQLNIIKMRNSDDYLVDYNLGIASS